MTHRINPDDIDAALGSANSSAPGPAPAPPSAPMVRVTVAVEGRAPEVIEGLAALVTVTIAEGPMQHLNAVHYSNVHQARVANMLGNLIAEARRLFGEVTVDAALELSRTVQSKGDWGTAPGGGGAPT